MEAHPCFSLWFSWFYLSTPFQVKVNVAGDSKRKIKFPLGCNGQRMIAQLHMLLWFRTLVGAILGTLYICCCRNCEFSAEGVVFFVGLPQWLSSKRIHLWCRRHRFNPWVWKIPWRRKWQPTPVILPRKSHGQRNLAGYSPWGQNTTEQLNNWVCDSHEMPGKAIENACLGLCGKIQMEDCVKGHLFLALGMKETSPRKKGKR